jgi:putative glutamine amidotransferase
VKPLIGITTSSFTSPTTGWEYNRAYVACIQAIADVGGLPVLIPTSVSDDVLRAIYDRVDGVLLPGGGDVDPEFYGALKHPKTGEADNQRDHVELQVASWALDEDLPLLGICRGHQVLGVALGGKLVQDIPSLVSSELAHDLANVKPRDHEAHSVEIDPSSRLARILGTTRVDVNSLHHQSLEAAPPGACVTAYAPDGVIEAMELPDKKFALSVQWHPEDMYRNDESMKRLFRAFVEAATNGTNGRTAH